MVPKVKAFRWVGILVIAGLTAACAGPQARHEVPKAAPKPSAVSSPPIVSLEAAADRLADRLAPYYREILAQKDLPAHKAVLMRSADADPHTECVLARDVIERIADRMIQHHIHVVSPSLREEDDPCSGYIENLAIRETAVLYIDDGVPCKGGGVCFEAKVRVVDRMTGERLFVVDERFSRTEGTQVRYGKKHWIKSPPGSRQRPYADVPAAARGLAAQLAYFKRMVLLQDDNLSLVVGKTDTTGSMASLVVSEELVGAGLSPVLQPQNWLRVVLRTDDMFELPEFDTEHLQKFGTANAVVCIDGRSDGNGLTRLVSVLVARRSMSAYPRGVLTSVQAGDPIPLGKFEVWFRSRSDGGEPESVAGDGQGCQQHPGTKVPGAFDLAGGLVSPREAKARGTVVSEAAKAAWDEAQRKTLRTLNARLNNRLRRHDMAESIVRALALDGMVEMPRYRQSEHYLSPKMPCRTYCRLDYELTLKAGDNKVLAVQGFSEGRGSSRRTAANDALKGIVAEMLPTARDIGDTLSRRKTIEELRRSLEDLNREQWHLGSQGDWDDIARSIEKMIEDLAREQ